MPVASLDDSMNCSTQEVVDPIRLVSVQDKDSSPTMKQSLSPIDSDDSSPYCDRKMSLYRPPSLRNSSVLVRWIKEHRNSPYPSKGDKQMLAVQAGMTLTQVSNWFANARRRIKKIGMEEWLEVHAGALSDRPLQPFRYPIGINVNFPPVSGYSSVGSFPLCGTSPQPPMYENPPTPQSVAFPTFPGTYPMSSSGGTMPSPPYTALPPTQAGSTYHKAMLMSGGMHLPGTPLDGATEQPLHKLQQAPPFTPFTPLSLLSPRPQSAMLPQWPMNSPQSATLPSMPHSAVPSIMQGDQRKEDMAAKPLHFLPGSNLYSSQIPSAGLTSVASDS